MSIPIKKITRHTYHYLPLLGIIMATIFGFYLFPFDKLFQYILGIAGASGYISWGLVHHHIHKDLHTSIVLEYFAVAFLGVVILFFVLFRA
jgi:hypothetical protein